MPIAETIQNFHRDLPAGVTLVAVSKTKPISDIEQAYQAGHRDFGENKIQEMADKWESLPKDIRWHMIGHVQTNKVKYMAPFVHLIHAVDSEKLLKEINKRAAQNDRTIHCLLQVKIAEEESKFGLSEDDALEILRSSRLQEMPHVQVDGLMGMATFTDDQAQLRREFERLQHFYNQHQAEFGFHTLSMGMSGDYPLAMECGSTMIRVGSAIFGERNYH